MMTYEWISPAHMTQIAAYLLELDTSAIEPLFQSDIQQEVFSLRSAFTQYQYYSSQANAKMPLEYYAATLLERIKAFFPLLTADARMKLRTYAAQLSSTRTKNLTQYPFPVD